MQILPFPELQGETPSGLAARYHVMLTHRLWLDQNAETSQKTSSGAHFILRVGIWK